MMPANDNYNTRTFQVGDITQLTTSNCYVHVATATQQWCDGNVYVFACEQADKCRCGKATRQPEPKKCGVCGK
jgi:hypothetical protein